MASTERGAKPAGARRRAPISASVPGGRLTTTVVVALVVVLGAELFARSISAHLPPLLTGDEVEMEIKADQVAALGAGPEGDQPQVVFFGNSMTDAGISPETVATASQRWDRVYNASLIGAPVTSEARWAERHVLNRVDPDVVVLGVSPLDLIDVNPLDLLDVGDGETRSQAVEAAFDATLDELSPSIADELFGPVEEHSQLVRHRGSLRSPRQLWRALTDTLGGEPVRESIPQVATVEGGEVVPRDRAFWESAIRPTGGTSQFHDRRLDVTRDPDLEGRISEAAATAAYRPARLRTLLDAVVEEGREVVVVAPPIATAAMTPAAVARLEDLTERMADEAERAGAGFVDFTAAAYPLSAFADVAHLNGPGSERFSADLGARLDAEA